MMWDILVGAVVIYFILKFIFGRRDDNIRGPIKVSHVYSPASWSSKELVTFKVETIDGVFYLWDNDSDDFLAQGDTLEDAVNNMIKRFPGKVFRGNDESLGRQN